MTPETGPHRAATGRQATARLRSVAPGPGGASAGAAGICDGCRLSGADLCRTIREAPAGACPPGRPRRYRAGAVVQAPGQTGDLLGVLRRGYLRQGRRQAHGRQMLLGLAAPGDLVGSLPGERAELCLTAATEAEICIIPAALARRLLETDHAFRARLLVEAERLHARQAEMIWRRGALTSRERIVASLVDAVATMPTERARDGSLILRLEVSRRDWADLSDTSVESISRELARLRRLGVVEMLSARSCRIRDLARLMRLAGMDPEEDGPLGRSGDALA